ncbi:MAG: tRNA pseudouridine(38-40) synthase TruA [Geobacter sp.]|nr:tRNA pseudouridine(38-40) synthase TruA [Geobacter sp.]
MRNIKLTIEYDGTSYAGWQIQPNGLAIQQVMEEALAKMLQESVRLHSSGRTDAGVHAQGMVAAFTTERTIPLRAFTEGLNALLPSDIAVRDAAEMPLEFHPRFDAQGKRYRYTLHIGRYRSPLCRLYAWHVRGKLDLEKMREAAGLFIGEKDFASFRTVGCAARTTVRRIDAVRITQEDDLVHIDVTGSGFLRNMVRIMAGTLVAVGRGKLSPDDVNRCFEVPGTPAGPTSPPHGLCLIEVYY